MSSGEFWLVWLAAFVYVGYVVVLAVVTQWLLPGPLGVVAFLPLALGPIMGWAYRTVVR